MSLFTEDELRELETVFGISRLASTSVKDGRINADQMVWWRGVDGPELVLAAEHWDNIKQYPNAYSINKPRTKITYLD